MGTGGMIPSVTGNDGQEFLSPKENSALERKKMLCVIAAAGPESNLRPLWAQEVIFMTPSVPRAIVTVNLLLYRQGSGPCDDASKREISILHLGDIQRIRDLVGTVREDENWINELTRAGSRDSLKTLPDGHVEVHVGALPEFNVLDTPVTALPCAVEWRRWPDVTDQNFAKGSGEAQLFTLLTGEVQCKDCASENYVFCRLQFMTSDGIEVCTSGETTYPVFGPQLILDDLSKEIQRRKAVLGRYASKFDGLVFEPRALKVVKYDVALVGEPTAYRYRLDIGAVHCKKGLQRLKKPIPGFCGPGAPFYLIEPGSGELSFRAQVVAEPFCRPIIIDQSSSADASKRAKESAEWLLDRFDLPKVNKEDLLQRIQKDLTSEILLRHHLFPGTSTSSKAIQG